LRLIANEFEVMLEVPGVDFYQFGKRFFATFIVDAGALSGVPSVHAPP
jgi:hypothetical protein